MDTVIDDVIDIAPPAAATPTSRLAVYFAFAADDKQASQSLMEEAMTVLAAAARDANVNTGFEHEGAGIVEPLSCIPSPRTNGVTGHFYLQSGALPKEERKTLAAAITARFPDCTVRKTLLGGLHITDAPGL